MSLISKRLKLFIQAKGLKITNLEKEIGVSNSTLARPLKDGKGIKTETLEKLLPLLKIHPVWLCFGIGEMEYEEIDKLKHEEINEIDREYINEYGVTEKGFSDKFGNISNSNDLTIGNILDLFINLPAIKQSEIKGTLTSYLHQISKDIREATETKEEDLEDEKEQYKKRLMDIQILAENKIRNKRLEEENRKLKNIIKKLKSQ